MSYCVRIDQPSKRTHGWQGRVHVRGRTVLTKFYADRKYGTASTAKKLATQFVRRVHRALDA